MKPASIGGWLLSPSPVTNLLQFEYGPSETRVLSWPWLCNQFSLVRTEEVRLSSCVGCHPVGHQGEWLDRPAFWWLWLLLNQSMFILPKAFWCVSAMLSCKGGTFCIMNVWVKLAFCDYRWCFTYRPFIVYFLMLVRFIIRPVNSLGPQVIRCFVESNSWRRWHKCFVESKS